MAYRDACKRGHPFVDGSFYWRPDGSRKCRICDIARRSITGKAKRARLRAEAVTPPPIALSGQEPTR